MPYSATEGLKELTSCILQEKKNIETLYKEKIQLKTMLKLNTKPTFCKIQAEATIHDFNFNDSTVFLISHQGLSSQHDKNPHCMN